MKSPKQVTLEKRLLKSNSGKVRKAVELLIHDKEIQHLQDYANTVSIRRLKYNDHGPVHMRTVTRNALALAELLNKANVPLSLEAEDVGTFENSRIAVLIASFLHDIGMSVGRPNHEHAGVALALPIINRLLLTLYPDNLKIRVIIRSLITEGIVGHMGTQEIHSLEAGIILVADGCDMEQGRARIPLLLDTRSRVGDIHKYSSNAVKEVALTRGKTTPIRITVTMTESVGFFQVEEVLAGKINASPIKNHIELYAGVVGEKMKRYQ